MFLVHVLAHIVTHHLPAGCAHTALAIVKTVTEAGFGVVVFDERGREVSCAELEKISSEETREQNPRR